MNTATRQLALLLGALPNGDTAPHHDLVSMAQALQARGVPADRILSLHGRLDRPLVLSFLQAARRQMAGWREGTLFFHVGGHGFSAGDAAETARPGLLLDDTDDVNDDYHLFWDEVFDALDLPPGVHLTLLPDLWHSNLLAGRVPVHTSALVMQAQPGAELACRGHNYDFPAGDGTRAHGVISYYATKSLPNARTMSDWLAHIETLVRRDVEAGRLPAFYRPDLQILGDEEQPVPGTTSEHSC